VVIADWFELKGGDGFYCHDSAAFTGLNLNQCQTDKSKVDASEIVSEFA